MLKTGRKRSWLHRCTDSLLMSGGQRPRSGLADSESSRPWLSRGSLASPGEAQGRACFNQPISEGPTPLSRRCCLGWMLLALTHALIVLAFNGEEGEYCGPRSCRGSLPTSCRSLRHEWPQSLQSSEVDLVGWLPASGMASPFRSFQVTLCFRKNSLQKPLLKLLSNSFSEESEAKLAGLSAQPASQLAPADPVPPGSTPAERTRERARSLPQAIRGEGSSPPGPPARPEPVRGISKCVSL